MTARRRVIVELTALETFALVVAARAITEAPDMAETFGMDGHDLAALARAQAKLTRAAQDPGRGPGGAS